jgi:hypothetical protein
MHGSLPGIDWIEAKPDRYKITEDESAGEALRTD